MYNKKYIIYYIYGMFEIHEDTIQRKRERDATYSSFLWYLCILLIPIDSYCLFIDCVFTCVYTIFWWWLYVIIYERIFHRADHNILYLQGTLD